MEESNQKQDQDQEPKTLMLDEKVENWSEHVENLRDSGDTDGAISFLELFISRLYGGSSTSTGDLQLAAAMGDLADLYSLRGYTIKSDEMWSRAFSVRSRINEESSTPIVSANSRVAQPTATISVREKGTEGSILSTTSNNDVQDNEDDWETLADKAETEINLLSLKPKAETSLAESGNLEHKEKDLRLDSLIITERENEGDYNQLIQHPKVIKPQDFPQQILDNQLIQHPEVINYQNEVFCQWLLDFDRFIQTATPMTLEEEFDDYEKKLKVMLSVIEEREQQQSAAAGPSSSHQMIQPPEMQSFGDDANNGQCLGQYNDEPNFD